MVRQKTHITKDLIVYVAARRNNDVKTYMTKASLLKSCERMLQGKSRVFKKLP